MAGVCVGPWQQRHWGLLRTDVVVVQPSIRHCMCCCPFSKLLHEHVLHGPGEQPAGDRGEAEVACARQLAPSITATAPALRTVASVMRCTASAVAGLVSGMARTRAFVRAGDSTWAAAGGRGPLPLVPGDASCGVAAPPDGAGASGRSTPPPGVI